jgi:hypothetical protein
MMRFQLPYPPSGWDLYKGWGKTRSLSTTYKKWRNDAGYFIKRPETPISVPFSISIALRNKDADERRKRKPFSTPISLLSACSQIFSTRPHERRTRIRSAERQL